MKRKGKYILIVTVVLTIVIVIAVIYIQKNDFDIRDKAAEGEFNVETYRGMARFGIGHLMDAYTNDTEMKELSEYKFGWFHNWYHKKSWICGLMRFSTVNIPESLDYYGFVGDWGPNETTCSQSFKDELSVFEDGDVIWIGNEIGWDDKRDPTTYARQYKSWYDCIKAVNPNIKVAPGANPGNPTWDYWVSHMEMWVVKEDPKGRWSVNNEKQINYIEYLTYVKADYKEIYGVEMPLDAYVIHIYGVEGWNNVGKIKDSIVAFREYMKNEGHRTYHLYVKEMGILPNSANNWNENGDTMVEIFNMLLNSKDQNIGNLNDNNRLVQRWAWFVGPVACYESTAYEDCLWKYTGFYHCKKVREEDESWNTDCISYRKETPLGARYKQYVDSIWDSYDHTPPDKPDISYTLDGNVASITFSATDNGRINNYEISVGSSEGETDIMLWTSTDTKTSYIIDDAVGKYVNVKAIDDGYNWSEVASERIEEGGKDDKGKYDIAPKGNPDGKVDVLDLAILLYNWKWKGDERNEDADINKDGDVDMLDLSLLLSNWTKKY